ncbi:MAG TPA: hypothetical protein VHS30_36625 [Streptosporangiaceae bacterium]|nr:hypothetical protein [Streptosporangiaceae bacterium]
MLGPPAASIPRQGDGEPDRRGGQRQLDQNRLPHGQQPVQAGRRHAQLEPGVGKQQRGLGGGRQAGPRASPG